MGRTASRAARGDGPESARRPKPPSFESFQRSTASASAGEAHSPTVREFLPWHEVEAKLAARAPAPPDVASERDVVALDEGDEPPPDSGVRASENAPLTYRVYTLADLEARATPEIAWRVSRASMASLPPKPSKWSGVAASARELVRAAVAWARMPAPRARPADVLRFPATAFFDELQGALRAVNWKKVGVYAAVGATTLVVLLFAVLTAAELTDDLKPTRATSSSTKASTVIPTFSVAAQAPPALAGAADESAPEAAPAQIEILDPPEPAPRAPQARGRARVTASRGAPAEIFIP